MVSSKLGFVGSSGCRVGGAWILDLTTLLYDVSTFHEKFKAHGFTLPPFFAFTKDANDWKKKGIKAPEMKQDVVSEVYTIWNPHIHKSPISKGIACLHKVHIYV